MADRDATANDVDLDTGPIRVVGKGNRERPIYARAGWVNKVHEVRIS